MSEFKIEYDVPLPASKKKEVKKRKTFADIPFDEMKAGGSILIETCDNDQEKVKKRRSSIYVSLKRLRPDDMKTGFRVIAVPSKETVGSIDIRLFKL